MRLVLVNLILIGILAWTPTVGAADAADLPPGARGARHMVIPFLGYNVISGENVGYTYEDMYYDIIADTIAFHNEAKTLEHKSRVPELGLTYRYIANDLLTAEVTLSTVEDKTNFDYLVRYDASYYTQRSTVTVSRTNTTKFVAGVTVNVPMGIDWIQSAVKLNGGYAWRDIKATSERRTEVVGFLDSEDMYIAQVGLDFGFWTKTNMIIEGTVYYTQYIPTDSEIDPYSSIGWGIRVFPLWSAQRR